LTETPGHPIGLPTTPYTIIEVATRPNDEPGQLTERFIRVIDYDHDPYHPQGDPYVWLGVEDGMHVPTQAIDFTYGWRVIGVPVGDPGGFHA
jgi:hypothetical protein